MFPATDDSATIMDCLTRAASRAGVQVRTGCKVRCAIDVAIIFHHESGTYMTALAVLPCRRAAGQWFEKKGGW